MSKIIFGSPDVIRLRGLVREGGEFYIVVKPANVKLVNRQNEDIGFGQIISETAACRFELEDVRDTVIPAEMLPPGYTEREVKAQRMVHIMQRYTNGIVWDVFTTEQVSRFYTSGQASDLAFEAAYLLLGYTDACRRHPGWMPQYQQDNGHTGVVGRLCELAKIVIKHLETGPLKALLDGDGFPGVFQYEITEAMGAWFHANSECTDEQFEAKLVEEISAWTTQD